MGKVKITLHKNELAKYFIKDYRTTKYKLGCEVLNRWVDVPEYIQVEGEGGLSDYSRGYQLGYVKGKNEKNNS